MTASRSRPLRQIDTQKVIETIETLRNRVHERFPGAGLAQVVSELGLIAGEAAARTTWIRRPIFSLRIAGAVLTAGILGLVGLMISALSLPSMKDTVGFIQFIDSGMGSLVFIGATVIFLFSWEARIKRGRALKAIHELRALAHIVDMHQLTKDPDRYLLGGNGTASSPKRTMTAFELGRYLDYCSEILSLISKIAALYVQDLADQVVLDAADDVENLTTGLSRKIWQKISILDAIAQRAEK